MSTVDTTRRDWLSDLIKAADKKHASAKGERLHYASLGRELPDDHRIPAEIAAVLYRVNVARRHCEKRRAESLRTAAWWLEQSEMLHALDVLLQIELDAANFKGPPL